jgi:hypothetical protein
MSMAHAGLIEIAAVAACLDHGLVELLVGLIAIAH